MDFREVKATRKGEVPLTLKQVDSIYWLGRYTERVLTTLKVFMDVYDSQLDSHFDYAKYCSDLDIYNGFSSLSDFCQRYAFDRTYASSIISSMNRSYDNAIMLRETIGSDSLSYIELALRRMEDAQYSQTPALVFQKVIDNIMAFKGQVFDSIADHNVRHILLAGLTLERLDMYLRLNMNEDKIAFECRRLTHSIERTDINCDRLALQKVCGELCEKSDFMDNADKMILLQLIDGLFMKIDMAA
ncbi:alpha-E domain-containing protein [Treponema sp.]|uniref:alpha-E domain-containing protein n=1 Tax=Treponema sp. TaxID=166 RepID=UPI00388EF06B